MKIQIERILVLGLGGAALLVGASALGQATPSPEDWQYREDAESCRAFRWFGSGEGRMALQLRSFGPGSAIEARVASPRLPREPDSVRHVELGWDGEETVSNQVGLLSSVEGIPSVTLLVTHRPVSAFSFSDEGATVVSPLVPASETMDLRVVGGVPIDLQTGSLEEPLRRLAECEASLMQKWGWGRDYAQRVATAPVMRDPQSWFFRAITWPAVPRLKRVSSILQLRLKIDARGRVSECVVQSSPGSSQFGSKNCDRLPGEARFTPALDSQGRPVESHLQMSVTFGSFD